MRRILLAGTALTLTLTSIVPSTGLAAVRPGVELGVNVSSLSFDDPDIFPLVYWDTSWRPSFTGGLSLEVPFQGRWSLHTGLRYVQQGNRVEFDLGPVSPGFTGKFRFVQHYVSLPMLLAWRPLPSNRFFISAGPEFAVLLAAELVTEENSLAPGTSSRDIKDDLVSTNLSLDAGAGYEFPLANHLGTAELRYSHGLTGVAREQQWVSDWKTRGIEALVGVRW
jgi:hypothetical protein